MRKLTLENTRKLAIYKQALSGTPHLSSPNAILNLVQDLGCLQLDPISAVARSHSLVLFSRLGNYDPAHLDQLLWRDHMLFEYWAHCAAIVPTSDYAIHNLMMRDYGNTTSTWGKRRLEWIVANAPLREHILSQIRERGPLPSRMFENKEVQISDWWSTGWNSGRNVSRMLDFLWMEGTLMVAGRSGIQKLWDLSERCLPESTPRHALSPREVTHAAVQRAIRALGVATPSQIKQHFIRGRYAHLPEVLADLQQAGVIEPVQMVGERKLPGTWYLHRDDVAVLERIEAGDWHPRTVLLSPFDNLICDRKRTKQLWNFDFTIEIYVPKAKRKYGYYVMPILHGDRLIGRVDSQMNHRSREFEVNRIYYEADVAPTPDIQHATAAALAELAAFLRAKAITYA